MAVLVFDQWRGTGTARPRLPTLRRPPAVCVSLQALQFVFTNKTGLGLGVTTGIGFTICKQEQREDGTAAWSAPCFLLVGSISVGATIGGFGRRGEREKGVVAGSCRVCWSAGEVRAAGVYACMRTWFVGACVWWGGCVHVGGCVGPNQRSTCTHQQPPHCQGA